MGHDDEPRLIRIDTPEREEYPIPEGTTRIGRSRGLDICLTDTAVSRFHCYLLREGDKVRVFAGESKNPARVNGEDVNGQTLKCGHTLRIGRCQLVYEGPLPQPVSADTGSHFSAGESPKEPALFAPAGRSRRRLNRSATSAPRVSKTRRPVALFITIALSVLGACGLVGLLLWLPGINVRREGSGDNTGYAERIARSQTELERLMAELEKKLAAKEDTAGFESLIEDQKRRIAELGRELTEERDRDRTSNPAARARGGLQPDAQESREGILFPELESAPQLTGTGERGSQDTKTVVVKRSSPSVKRTKKEIGDLVARLCAKIDDYATHTVFPPNLEPDLTDLSACQGMEAAEGLLAVHQHARSLERQVDAGIEANEKRKAALLVKAEQAAPIGDSPLKKANDKGAGMYGNAVGVETERDQRLLELFGKAAEIHSRHRDHLIPLKQAVLEAFERLSDLDALDCLRTRFVGGDDVELLKAMLSAFSASNDRRSVPALYGKLGVTKDAGLKNAIRRTLTSVTGQDLGDKAPAWAEWWGREKR